MTGFRHKLSESPARQSLLFASVLTLLQALPWLLFLVFKISPIAFAGESIAYRYFHTYRLLHGDTSGVWLPQGQTLGVFHLGAQRVLDAAGITELHARMDLFGYGTLVFNTLLFGFVLYAISRALASGWTTRLLLAVTTLFGIYGTRWGLIADSIPDYYVFEITFTVLCLGLFLIGIERSTAGACLGKSRWIAALGVLAGAMLGIKMTLLPAALLPLLPWLMRTEEPPPRIAAMLGLWGAIAAITLGGVIATYYLFDFHHLRESFRQWRSFVTAPGAEPGFVASILHPFAPKEKPWVDHRFVYVIGAFWLAALGIFARATIAEKIRRPSVVLGISALATSALHVLAVCKRPADTTLFESALFLVAISCVLLAMLPGREASPRPIRIMAALLAGWCVLSTLRHFPGPDTVRGRRVTSSNAWEMHTWLNATGLPVVVLLPDNRYISGSVEEALLKGFSQLPTWDVTAGYPLLDSVAPRRRFVTRLSAAPPGSVLVWTDVPNVPPLATNPSAGVLGAVPLETRTWPMQIFPHWTRTVHAAVFSDEDSVANRVTLKSNLAWRESMPANPIPGFSISPGEANAKVELRSEAGATVVRVTATKSTSYLALGGGIPPLKDGAGPLLLDARVSTNSARPVLWQLYDVIDAKGAANPSVESVTTRANLWTRWILRKPTVTYASATDNFSVGIVGVQPGDWFEVSTLILSVESAAAAGSFKR